MIVEPSAAVGCPGATGLWERTAVTALAPKQSKADVHSLYMMYRTPPPHGFSYTQGGVAYLK